MAGSPTILVVEDDPMVRALLDRLLSAEGFTVLAAGDGEDALTVLRKLNGHISLVVTDLRMPRMGGLELAEHLTAWTPAPPVLFISGYARGGGILPGPFVAKPFRPDEVVTAVRSLLDNGSPTDDRRLM